MHSLYGYFFLAFEASIDDGEYGGISYNVHALYQYSVLEQHYDIYVAEWSRYETACVFHSRTGYFPLHYWESVFLEATGMILHIT